MHCQSRKISYLLFAISASSCTPRRYNDETKIKNTGDIESMSKDPATGLFTVKCSDGRTERGITPEQIQSGEVCKGAPASDVTQVNAKAFNAFKIWKDKNEAEIIDYPENWRPPEDPSTLDSMRARLPDSVFFSKESEFQTNFRFIAVPTEGAQVVNSVLEYPVKNAQQLKIKFQIPSTNEVTHYKAARDCKEIGMRLPTARELFDFCAVGVSEPNYGPNFKIVSYPRNARCSGVFFWSASVNPDSYNLSEAWYMNGLKGNLEAEKRGNLFSVICAGVAGPN